MTRKIQGRRSLAHWSRRSNVSLRKNLLCLASALKWGELGFSQTQVHLLVVPVQLALLPTDLIWQAGSPVQQFLAWWA